MFAEERSESDRFGEKLELMATTQEMATAQEKPPSKSDILERRELAYIVSEYPKISHSFIRREIHALEKRGWQIHRFAARGWKDLLVDPADLAEQKLTLFILQQGAVRLLWATLALGVSRPGRFWRTLVLAGKMMSHSDRPAILHLIYLMEACWLSRRLIEAGIRHLHAHFGTNPAEVAMLSSELTGIPFSFTVHGPEEFDKVRAIHLAEKIRRAKFVIAVSSFGRSQLFRTVEYSQWFKVKVVHCGVDSGFAALESIAPSSSNRLVCVGRLCEQKGQALLVSAAAILHREGLKFELVFVGDGEQRSVLEDLIKRHDLGGIISITGWADASSVRREMISSRVLILPSFAEGLPVVIMEAMALGRPVITTYVAGNPELVLHGETGWLIPAGSEEALCCAIRECFETSDEKLGAMGEIGRARALSRHNIDCEAEKLEKLFERSLRCST
jgi:colanic acid/amylovoran biosynthesis glycosyltransferase